MEYTVHLPPLSGESIAALASADNRLYVSTGRKLFLVSPRGTSAAIDVSQRIKKAAEDEVTDILVDVIHHRLWIVLNGNTRPALCYDYDLLQKECVSTFLDRLLGMYQKLQESHSSPAKSSIEVLVYDSQQALVGYFKGDVYLYSIADDTFKLVYKPTSVNNWATAAVLTKATAFVVTRGDGLVAVNRKDGAAKRFPNQDGISLRTIAAHEQDLYLGATGLHRAKIADFASSLK